MNLCCKPGSSPSPLHGGFGHDSRCSTDWEYAIRCLIRDGSDVSRYGTKESYDAEDRV